MIRYVVFYAKDFHELIILNVSNGFTTNRAYYGFFKQHIIPIFHEGKYNSKEHVLDVDYNHSRNNFSNENFSFDVSIYLDKKIYRQEKITLTFYPILSKKLVLLRMQELREFNSFIQPISGENPRNVSFNHGVAVVRVGVREKWENGDVNEYVLNKFSYSGLRFIFIFLTFFLKNSFKKINYFDYAIPLYLALLALVLSMSYFL